MVRRAVRLSPAAFRASCGFAYASPSLSFYHHFHIPSSAFGRVRDGPALQRGVRPPRITKNPKEERATKMYNQLNQPAEDIVGRVTNLEALELTKRVASLQGSNFYAGGFVPAALAPGAGAGTDTAG